MNPLSSTVNRTTTEGKPMNVTTTPTRIRRPRTAGLTCRPLATLTVAVQLAAMLLVFGLPALVSALADRVRRLQRDERGDAGGKTVVVLILTILGIAAAVGIGLLIKAQIDKRSPDLDKT